MGSQFVGALVYSDDITLLAPCKLALSILIRVFEYYAAEYDIMFNGNRSKLLFFKGRFSGMVPSEIIVNGQIVSLLFTLYSVNAIVLIISSLLGNRSFLYINASFH